MDRTKTHYGVVGLGSIGTVFATMLKQAGHRVSVLEKSTERAGVASGGTLKVSGEYSAVAGPFEVFCEVAPFIATRPDVILVCTKSCDSLVLSKQMRRAEPRENTVFVSCQNGLDVEEQITEVFGAGRSLRMVLNLGCGIVSERETSVVFAFIHHLSLKEALLSQSQKICDDFNAAGLRTKLTKEYRKEAYKKAILNCAMGGACAVTGMRMREAMEHPEISWIIKEMIRESLTVAEALGLGIDPGYFDEAVQYLAKGGSHKPSMLVDIENKRPTENEYLAGKIYRFARERGVKVPVIQTIYYLVKRLESMAC